MDERTEEIEIDFTPEEWAIVEENAKAAGMAPEDFIREAGLGHLEPVAIDVAELEALNAQLEAFIGIAEKRELTEDEAKRLETVVEQVTAQLH